MADYKVTAAELASIANAIRLKGGTSAFLEYPSEWITAIQNLVPASGGSEITPLDPTVIYKVTDTELVSIANAIREKCGTSELLEFPSEFISAIQNIPTPTPPVEIVSWASGTDSQIAAMVSALDDGTITIEQTGWKIGDERVVSLSEMGAIHVGETHAAQNAVFVLMDSQHFNLTNGGLDHFVVGMKDCLNELGYMNNSHTTSGSWQSCARRAWCNDEFKNSIPEGLRGCFKQFEVITGNVNSSNIVTSDYFALFAEKEIQGERSHSTENEASALNQIEYYKTSSNKVKKWRTNIMVYWDRSPATYQHFAQTSNSGAAALNGAANNAGISPFGCI